MNKLFVVLVILLTGILILNIAHAECVNLSDESTYQNKVHGSMLTGFTVNDSITLCEDTYDFSDVTAITIDSDNITVDCNGSTLIGNWNPPIVGGHYGIENNGKTRVIIKNCVSTDWWTGIYFHSGVNDSLINNTTANSNYYGFYISSSSGNNITNSHACGNFHTDLSDDNLANNWFISVYTTSNPNNTTYFDQLHDCSWTPPSACVGFDYNFYFGDIVNESCIMNGNLSTETEMDCFRIYSDNITINCQDYTIDGQGWGGTGIVINSSNATVKNCIVTGCYKGIYSYGNYGNFINNTINNNGWVGFLFDSSSNNVLINNTANLNSVDGVMLWSSSLNNTFINNTFNSNEHYGIEIYGASSGNNFTETTTNDNILDGIVIYGLNNTFINTHSCNNRDYDFEDDRWNNIFKNSVYDTSTPSNKTYFDQYSNCSGILPPACVGLDYRFHCGNIINESCVLTGSLDSLGTCFLISVDNITIDGSGYSITGNGSGNGIDVKNNSITIENFANITNFFSGVYSNLANGSMINNTIENNQLGIYLDEQSSYNNITNNTINYNQFQGIDSFGNSNSIINNTVNYNQQDGIYFNTGSSNNIINNTVNYNQRYGLAFSCYDGDGCSGSNNLLNNTVNHNQQDGIYFDRGSNDNNINNTFSCYNRNDDLDNYWEGNIFANSTYDASNPTDTTYFNQTGTCPILPLQNITDCQSLNTPNTVYYLQNDVNGTGSDCFSITSYNITLNCQNHKIDGQGLTGTGVTVSYPYATIKNCIITNFSYGIYSSGDYGDIMNNTVSYSQYYGMDYVSSYTNITNNTLNNNQYYGVYLEDGSANNTIKNNKFSLNNPDMQIEDWENVFQENSFNNTIVDFTFPDYTDTISINSLNTSDIDPVNYSNISKYIHTDLTSTQGICTGNPGDCHNYDGLQGDCESQSGCTWNYTDEYSCEGTYDNCCVYNNQDDCGNFGCTWNFFTPWIFLNISYSLSDLKTLNESSLILAKYNPGNCSGSLNCGSLNDSQCISYSLCTDNGACGGSLNCSSLNETGCNTVPYNYECNWNEEGGTCDNHGFCGNLGEYNRGICNTLNNVGCYWIFVSCDNNGGCNDQDENTCNSNSFVGCSWQNESWDTNMSNFLSDYGINTINKIVYANITNSDGLFGVFGTANGEKKKNPGSGGGGNPENTTNPTNNTENNTGTEATLDVGDLGKFLSSGNGVELNLTLNQTFQFMLNGTSHTVKIITINTNQVTLLIYSNPIQVALNKGETKQIDLNDNGYDDLEITLKDIINGKADLLFKELKENTTTNNQTTKSAKTNYLSWVVVIIAVVVIILIILNIKRNQRKNRFN